MNTCTRGKLDSLANYADHRLQLAVRQVMEQEIRQLAETVQVLQQRNNFVSAALASAGIQSDQLASVASKKSAKSMNLKKRIILGNERESQSSFMEHYRPRLVCEGKLVVLAK